MDIILLALIIARIKFSFSHLIFSYYRRNLIESELRIRSITYLVLEILYFIDILNSYIVLYEIYFLYKFRHECILFYLLILQSIFL